MAGEQYLPFESERIDRQKKLDGNVKIFNHPSTKKVLREELHVRLDTKGFIEILSELKKELETLRSFGINVVNPDIIVGKYPYSPDNTGFVFTDFIEGLSLDKIDRKPDNSFEEKLIGLLQNFSRYYRSKSENKDGIIFSDIHEGQFVYGKVKNSSENDFWLVDIGTDGFIDFSYSNNIQYYRRNIIIQIYRAIKQILENYNLIPSNEIIDNFREAYMNLGGTEKMFSAKI